MRYTHPLVVLTLVVSSGCVAAHDAAPVVAAQKRAASALARHNAQTHAALVASTEALIEVRRAALTTRLEARALLLLYGEDPEPAIGGLSGGAAAEWLRRFESTGDRTELVAELPELEALEESASLTRAALASHEANAAALFADLIASTQLLEAYTNAAAAASAGEPRELLAELYRQELRGRLDGDEHRAAGDRIVALLLGVEGEQ